MYDQDEKENYTIKDVVSKIKLVQDIKLLHLQNALFNDKDVLITNIVDKNSLIKTIEKYRNHYSNIKINEHSIIITNLCELSYLRVGLEKEILKLIQNYF